MKEGRSQVKVADDQEKVDLGATPKTIKAGATGEWNLQMKPDQMKYRGGL